MKKRLLSLLIVMFAVLIPTQLWAEDGVAEPYAVLSEDSLGLMTLTFYYNGEKSSWNAMDVRPFAAASERGWDGSSSKILTVLFDDSFANYKPTSTAHWFQSCTSLAAIYGIENLKTDNVTDMSYMFSGCGMTSLDLSSFNTANLTNMHGMFYQCSHLTSLNMTGFKTDNVMDMSFLFEGCSGLISLDVSGFKTDNVMDMTSMFARCSTLTSLDVSGFKTGKVTRMVGTFANCSRLTSLDVTGFNTENVTDMGSMFYGCSGLTSLDLSRFKTDKVTKGLGHMFYGCSGLTNLDLSSFNTANVTHTNSMFENCSNLTTINVGSEWSTTKVEDGSGMFTNCTALVGGAGTTFDANHTDHTYAHIDGGPSNPGYFTAKGQGTGNGFSTCADVIAGEDGKTYRVKGRVKKIVNTTYGNWYIEDDTDSLYIYGTVDYAGRFPRNGMSWESHGVNVGDIVAVQGPKQTYNGTPELVNVRVLTPMTLLNVSSNDEDMSVMKDMQGIILSPNASTVTATLYYEGEDCEVIIPEEAQSWLTIQSTLKDNGDAEYKFDIINNSTSALRGDYILFRTTKIDSAIRDSVLYETKLYIGQAAPVSEPYAVLTGDTITGMTLTFYYDKQKTDRNGMSVGPFEVTNYDDYELVNSGWDPYRDHITSVVFDDSFADCQTITSTAAWFYDFTKLTTITNIGNLKTDNVYSMGDMFWGCESLETIDVSGFNTSNVWDFGGMFGYCFSLKSLDISNFDTSSSTWMRRMFDGCSKLTTLDVSKFKTDNVTNMVGLFMNCSGLTSLDVSGFKTDNVTDIYEMFYGCSGLTSLDVSGFNTEKVTSMWGMFSGCSSLTSLDVSHFDTKNVTSTTRMFDGCTKLTALDVSNFNTDNNMGLGAMFRGCSALTSIDVSRFNTSIAQYLWSMFEGCTNLTSIDVSGFNTEKVIQMSRMFKDCPLLTSIDVSRFKTDSLTTTREMFSGCSGLTNLDLRSFNTGNVTDMAAMFRGCSGLMSLDLSSFNTSKVIYDETSYYYGITGLFSECSGLTTIYVGDGWTTANLTESPNVFTNCTRLVGGKGTAYDSSHVDYTYAHIDGGPDNPGYFTAKGSSYNPFIYFIGSTDGWAQADQKLALTGEAGIYTGFVYCADPNGWGNEFKFQRVAGDWNSQLNAGSFTGGCTGAVDNSYGDDGNIKITEGEGVYYMTLNLGESTLNAVKVNKMGIIGDFNDWNGDVEMTWNPTNYCYEATNTGITTVGWKFRINSNWEINLGGTIDNLVQNGANLTVAGNIIRLYPTRKTSDNIYCTVDDIDDEIIQFADANVKAICVKNWDTNGDGELSKFEAATVSSLNGVFTNNRGITSFDEFQYFTGVTEIGSGEFMYCESLTSIILPATVQVIEQNAFFCCNIENFRIPASVTTINDGLYASSKYFEVDADNAHFCSVDGVVFTKDMTTLVVYPNKEGESYTIPRTVVTIGSTAFYTNPYLKSVVIPDGLKTIGGSAFRYCKLFESVNIPEGVESIGGDSFEGTALTSFTFPKTVTYIGEGVLSDCDMLTEIIVDPENENYCSIDGALYTKDGTVIMVYPAGKPVASVTVPEHVRDIATCAFYGNDIIESVTINKEVESIGWFAFIGCPKLMTVTMLKSNPIQTSTIFDNDFMESGTLYVPAGCAEAYRSTSTWNQIKNIVEMEPEVDYTFDYNGVLTVGGSTTLANALSAAGGRDEVAKTITAIVWNSTATLTNSDLQGLDNPNLLIYVYNGAQAPDRDNVIIDGVAKNIMLSDVTEGNGNFYCPQAFTVEMISYTRNFQQQTQVGVSRGWESIALPFDVQTILHEKQGVISPFSRNDDHKHFWLRRLSSNGLVSADKMEANVPYIISMPNSSEYPAEFNLPGRVTFSAANVTVPVTETRTLALADSTIMMASTMRRLDRSSSYYALNVGEVRGQYLEGSAFERDYREVRPFEAYTIHRSDTPAPRFVPINELNGGATGIENLIPSFSEGEGAWYDLNGRKLQQKPIRKGVYINGKHKMFVK